MRKLSKYLILTFCILSIWACDQKSTNKSPVRTTRSYRDGQVDGQNNIYGTGQGGGGNGGAGRIYADNENAFNNALRAMASASFDPALMGYVSPRDGVYMEGFIDINQNNINAANSNLIITIRDDRAISGQDRPIRLTLRGVQGQLRSNNQFVISFEDSYGAVLLQGEVNGNAIRGRVSYQNYKSFDNVSNRLSGDLGDFEIATCSLIRCN